MIDPPRRAVELGSDRGPKATIFLWAQADGAQVVPRLAGLIDVEHPLASAQRRPDRAWAEITPGRRFEIDPPLTRAEAEPAHILWRFADVPGWQQGTPVEAVSACRHDDVDVNAVRAKVDGGALRRLLPPAIDRDQAACERRKQEGDWNPCQRHQQAPAPAAAAAPPSSPSRHLRQTLPCLFVPPHLSARLVAC
jgi:hypothetical protein